MLRYFKPWDPVIKRPNLGHPFLRITHEKKGAHVIKCRGCGGLGYVDWLRGQKIIKNTTCFKCNGSKIEVINIG